MTPELAIELARDLIAAIGPILTGLAAVLAPLLAWRQARRNAGLIKSADSHTEDRVTRLEWHMMRVRQLLGDRGARPNGEDPCGGQE